MVRIEQQAAGGMLRRALPLWRRALAVVLSVTLFLAALLPAAALGMQPGHIGGGVVSVDADVLGDAADVAAPQHCPSFACAHSALPVAQTWSRPAGGEIELQFARIENGAPAREHEPPSKPPRS